MRPRAGTVYELARHEFRGRRLSRRTGEETALKGACLQFSKLPRDSKDNPTAVSEHVKQMAVPVSTPNGVAEFLHPHRVRSTEELTQQMPKTSPTFASSEPGGYALFSMRNVYRTPGSLDARRSAYSST